MWSAHCTWSYATPQSRARARTPLSALHRSARLSPHTAVARRSLCALQLYMRSGVLADLRGLAKGAGPENADEDASHILA